MWWRPRFFSREDQRTLDLFVQSSSGFIKDINFLLACQVATEAGPRECRDRFANWNHRKISGVPGSLLRASMQDDLHLCASCAKRRLTDHSKVQKRGSGRSKTKMMVPSSQRMQARPDLQNFHISVIKRDPFPVMNLTLWSHSLYFAYKVGIVSSYSNRIGQQSRFSIAFLLRFKPFKGNSWKRARKFVPNFAAEKSTKTRWR